MEGFVRGVMAVAIALAVAACGGEGGSGGETAKSSPATSPPPPKPAAAAAPARDALVGGPFPALLVGQAQFIDGAKPGPAKLTIVRKTGAGWKATSLEDPESNVFHKAMPYDGGILTIGGNEAILRVWRFANGQWSQATHWKTSFGGKQNRLRDIEIGDVDADGKDELVIATHDQGVLAVVHPDENWRVVEMDKQPSTFVHEIEIGDVDGDGKAEFFATPSKPNKLDEEQPGEVRMYKWNGTAWDKSIVDAPGDTHAKEVLAADVDGDGVSEVYVCWEGAVEKGGKLVRPVTIKQYRWKGGKFEGVEVAQVPDRQMRAIQAGDVNGDKKIDLVAGALATGLWLFEQDGAGWKKTLVDAQSSGYEHPVHLADLDGDGVREIYVASEDQGELRQYRWDGTKFAKTALAPLKKGDISWNVIDAKL